MLKRLNPYSGSYGNFGVFDIETSEKTAKDFKFGCVIWQGERKVFDDKNELLKYLLARDKIGTRWYCHNSEYDLSSLYENILTIPNSKILMSGSRFIELKVNVRGDQEEKNKKRTHKQKYIRFWDTFNLIPMALSKIGKSFKLPKLKYNALDIKKNNDAAIEYCFRDCEITELIVKKYEQFCEMFSIAPKLTTSSTALAIFRTQFLKNDVWIDDNDVFFKNSYVGGRTEVFKKVMKKGYHYDVNSLYPYAMCEKYYPNPAKIRRGVNQHFDYHLNNYEGVALIDVLAPDNLLIPVLPYRQDGKVIYPVGSFRGWYNFNELRFAIERGYKVLTVHEYYYAERMETPFKAYIDFWFNKKSEYKNVDAAFYDFSKRMQNGLYGKFGEYHDSGVWESCNYDPRTKEEITAGIDIFDLFDYKETSNGFGTWTKRGETIHDQKTDHTIFALCSYVTSYARMALYREFETSGLDHVYMCDTDSKFTDQFQADSPELGKMKLENNDDGFFYSQDCYFIAPKHYTISINIDCRDYIYYVIDQSKNHGENKLKGVRLGGKGVMEKSYIQKRVIKSREALRRGLESGAWVTMVKEPSGKDTKRIWDKTGHSKPFKLKLEIGV